MSHLQRVELTCSAEHYEFWLHWLLAAYQGVMDVMPIRRYGLAAEQLTRSEQVKGYAAYFRFNLTLSAAEWETLTHAMQQQKVPIELNRMPLG